MPTAGPASDGGSGPEERRGVSSTVIAAWISAGAVVLAAVITAAVTLWSPGAPTTTGTVADQPDPTQSPGPVGKLIAEEAYTHLGVPVFGDPQGDTIASGPPRIPFGTIVGVQCYAPNESGMGSVNDFYLVESPPQWRGDYAPANTFLNADTAGTLDPKVPKCPGT